MKMSKATNITILTGKTTSTATTFQWILEGSVQHHRLMNPDWNANAASGVPNNEHLNYVNVGQLKPHSRNKSKKSASVDAKGANAFYAGGMI